MSFGYRHRKEILIAIIFFITCGSAISYYYFKNHDKLQEAEPKETSSAIVSKKSSNDKSSKNAKKEETIYKVDIKGEINNPGIYSLNMGERVIDVINKAGGLTENADTTVINLSKKITDEMVIIIFSKQEVADFKTTTQIMNQVIDKCNQKDDNALTNDACIDKSSSGYEENKTNEQTLLNINSATATDLQTLPGIGETKALNIIKYRTEKGPFTDIEEIKNVEGIGDSLFAQIKTYITIE